VTERERRQRVVEHLRAGRTDDAAQELASSRETYPGDGMLHHAIGLAFAARGTLPAAREQLETAAQLSPASSQIVADLAQVRLAQGEAHEAIGVAEQALALDPDMPLARFTLGRALLAAECTRQARRLPPPEPGFHFPLLDARTPSYLRALREMEMALDAQPPFVIAVRGALAFAYTRAGHFHAAAQQLRLALPELPGGEEAEQLQTRLTQVEHEIAREHYWEIESQDLSPIEDAAQAKDVSPAAKLRLTHAYAALGRDDAVPSAASEAREAGYGPRDARIRCRTGEERSCRNLSDVHLLIAGGLECIVEDELRFLPFSSLQSVTLHEAHAWTSADVRFASGEEAKAVVPALYRLSIRSPNDLIQSGRFTQFSYGPGETRYAYAIGTRNLIADSGLIPFPDIESISFQ
jgi:protein involved in temperature-dependent protein secretion